MQNGEGQPPAGCCKNKLNGEAPVTKKFTPPEFLEYKPETELIFPSALRKHQFKPLAFGNKRKRWLRPVTLQQLLEIKGALPSAKIIGGSTETQIEVKFKNLCTSATSENFEVTHLRTIISTLEPTLH